MNLLLVNSFKNSCGQELKQIIERCYVLIEYSNLKFNQQDLGLICGIYAPIEIISELVPHQERLEEIGRTLSIDWVYVIPIDATEVGHFYEQAKKSGKIEAWKMYLELQYIFSSDREEGLL